MQKDLDKKVFPRNGHLQTVHPPFELQDTYVLAPQTLTEEERTAVVLHLKTCAYCKRMQETFRTNTEMRKIWRPEEAADEAPVLRLVCG